jgi:predicted amidohydrolase YtcJ
MPSFADTILTNGVIRTLDPNNPEVRDLAIANGRVVAVGQQSLDLRGPDTTVVDLCGEFVMPGLFDVHNHHGMAGQSDLFECNFLPTASLEEICEKVATWAQDLEPDAWIIGGSWGSGLLPELNTLETLARLDAATGGRPAILRDDSKHNRWANSRAMELAGIGMMTADPTGGQILREPSGAATGVLIEAGGVMVELALASSQPSSVDALANASERGIELLHSYGITAFQDAATSLQTLQALKLLEDQGRLKAWVVSSMQVNDFIFGTAPLGEGIIAESEQYRTVHHRPDFIKIFLDGVPTSRTAAMTEPYLPDDSHPGCFHGSTTMDPQELEAWLLGTAERGISAKIHCTGDASVRLVLDTVEKVRAAGYNAVKYHVAHGQFVHPDDLARFAKLDVTADISPSLWFPGVIADAIADVIPADRAAKMQPNRSLLDAGARIAGGSDWPVSVTPNVWEGVYGLITRQDPTGKFPGTLWLEQAISLDEAIAAYTTAAAEAMGLADIAGSLEVGKSADFIVLNSNPYEIPTELLPHVSTRETWFAGQKIYAA